ncbi:MAG: NYN domain-containing protein [Erythrobacter sp.]
MTITQNIALLIDADNASPSGLDPALTVLAELGSVNIKRAYGNWTKQGLKGWAALTQRYAIEPQQQFDITKGKNATDMKMAIDAMDLLYSGQVGGFGIMSSDGDFMPLVIRLRQNGLPVYGFGTDRAPEGFREACTRFFDVSVLAKSQADEEQSGEAVVDDAVVALLGDAWKASNRDDQGFAALSEVGQRATSRSSFDARNYGYSRLSDLVAALPQFVSERRDGGRVFIKRLR